MNFLNNSPTPLAPYDPLTDANTVFIIDAQNSACFVKDGSDNVTSLINLGAEGNANSAESGAGTFKHLAGASQHSHDMFEFNAKEFHFADGDYLNFTDISIYTVIELISSSGSPRFVWRWDSSENQFIFPYRPSSDGKLKFVYSKTGADSPQFSYIDAPVFNTTYINAGIVKSNGFSLVTPNTITADMAASTLFDSSGILNIGWEFTGNARIGEVIIRNVADDGHTAGRILQYLNDKWGA